MIQLRALKSSADSFKSWDLRCSVREQLIAFIQQTSPQVLPRTRTDLTTLEERAAHDPVPLGSR